MVHKILIKFFFLSGKVEAIDKDDAENARVYYYMVGGSEGCFLVDRTDGYISTNISLDREKKDNYDLYIKATNDPDYYASKVIIYMFNFSSVKI